MLGPSSFSPMSARALVIALERIDTSSLSVQDRKEYEYLIQLLMEGNKIHDSAVLDIELDLNFNLQANIADYGQFKYFDEEYKTDKREEIPIPYRYQDPFLSIYTNPFIYLNRKENADGTIDVNLDYFVGYNYDNEYSFSGYAYGPDAIVFSLGSEYADMVRVWSIGGRLLYKIQGDNRIKISSSGIDMSDVIFGHDPSSYMGINTPSSGWDDAEHLIKLTGYGSCNINEYGLSFYSAAGINTYFNCDNVQGETKFLPQATVGMKWSAI